MSRFQEFCEALQAGKARAEEVQLKREELLRDLPVAVGEVFRRLCASFRCPESQARYVDVDTDTVGGTVQGSPPAIRFCPEKGRYRLGLEIRVGAPADQDQYPVWLSFEFAPLKPGGLEFHLGSSLFQLPAEEEAFFNHVADAINHQLRQGCAPAPRRISF